MKVTFPHMGNLYLTARALIAGFGQEAVIPPPCTKKTLSLGTQYSPEFACLPLKINLGNYLEAAELGAEVIVMAGGVGPCRFGYYAQIQREILRDLGYDMEMVVLEPPDAHFRELVDKLNYVARTSWRERLHYARIAWWKTKAVDDVERLTEKTRAREAVYGTADRIYEQARDRIDRSWTKKEIRAAVEEASQALAAVEAGREEEEVVRIVLVGEIYTVLEPFMNLNLERHLGRMGVEVTRGIYLSEWINDHLFGGLLRVKGSAKAAKKMAAPYLNHFVGGHGLETVGSAVYYARQGFDGLIQVAPLTCMPEIVAESILPSVSREQGIPVMTIFLDEQTGEAGLVTRLEAFVDMIRRRKKQKKAGRLA